MGFIIILVATIYFAIEYILQRLFSFSVGASLYFNDRVSEI